MPKTDQTVDVSVCILTRLQPRIFRECVASCVSEGERAGLTIDIIVVDNASADHYPARVAVQFPRTLVIRNEENRGFSAANNQALEQSRGRYILVLNDDAILAPGSLKRMVDALAADPLAGAAGPKLVNPDGSIQRGQTHRRFPRLRAQVSTLLGLTPWLERHAWTRELFTHARDPEAAGQTDHLSGACLLLSRAALDAVGRFDERFSFYFEDTDLCYRLAKAGWKRLYVPDAIVIHYGSASFRQIGAGRNAHYFRSLIYFNRKHASRAKYLLVRAAVGLLLWLQAARGAIAALLRRDNSTACQDIASVGGGGPCRGAS
jgi:GT2 family glycosyltransferase